MIQTLTATVGTLSETLGGSIFEITVLSVHCIYNVYTMY